MRKQSHHARRGFSLLELLVALTLVTAALTVAVATTRQILRTMQELPVAEDHARTASRMLTQWRDDVFAATTFQCPNAITLILRNSEGEITWTIAPDGTMTRAVTLPEATPATAPSTTAPATADPVSAIAAAPATASAPPTVYPAIAPKGGFTLASPTVTLTSSYGARSATAEIPRLLNQKGAP